MSELFLSRLYLDPRRREAQRALVDCHVLHQRILAAFPTATTASPREEFAVLYRIDRDVPREAPVLLVQSTVRPDWSKPGAAREMLVTQAVPEVKEVSAAYETIGPGTRLRFRLRANPTRRVNQSHAGVDPLAGKRVELRDEQEQRDWLNRKGQQCGFQVIAVQVRSGAVPGGKQRGRRGGAGKPQPLTFGAATFNGVLEVTDAEAFRRALRQGIGSGKAYGFGLLSIAPA